MIITLPYPPSANTYWRHISKGKLAGRHLISEKGRAYREAVIESVLLQGARKKLEGLLKVEIAVYVPDRRRRDTDNLLKSLFDSMTHAGVWIDDSQVDDHRIYRVRNGNGELVIEGKVVVKIEAMQRKAV